MIALLAILLYDPELDESVTASYLQLSVADHSETSSWCHEYRFEIVLCNLAAGDLHTE